MAPARAADRQLQSCVARFRLAIEYAGTRYSGWQRQPNARTVQGALDQAIHEVTGETDFECQGSGRTDAGVHALWQVAHLDVHTSLPPETLRRRINDALPHDVHVLAMTRAPHRFHARHAAAGRSYLYQISRRRSAFAKPFVWWVKEPLDLARMADAAARFEGRHDFRTFSDDDPRAKSTLVQVDEVRLAEAGDLILVRVRGSHFLWKMVRRMVGVLVEIGRGGLAPAAVEAFLEGPSPEPARLTAPAAGLFLERVFYGDEAQTRPLVAPFTVSAAGQP